MYFPMYNWIYVFNIFCVSYFWKSLFHILGKECITDTGKYNISRGVQGLPYLWQCIFYQVSLIFNSEIENLLDGLIANDTTIMIKSIYSIWPNLFLMTDFNLPWKASQEARSTSWGIKAYSRSSSYFKLSSESYLLQTLLSRIHHTEKQSGFISGLLEGHSSLLMNAGMRAWIQLWVILEPVAECSLLKSPRYTIKMFMCPGKQFNFQNVQNKNE